LDTLFSSHNSSGDTEEFKNTTVFKKFVKAFRQREYITLIDHNTLKENIVNKMIKLNDSINENIYDICLEKILFLIWTFRIKGLLFRDDIDLIGCDWNLASQDMLDSEEDEKGNAITAIVRPSLINESNNKVLRKPLVCCAKK
jgi:hypothetical protein